MQTSSPETQSPLCILLKKKLTVTELWALNMVSENLDKLYIAQVSDIAVPIRMEIKRAEKDFLLQRG